MSANPARGFDAGEDRQHDRDGFGVLVLQALYDLSDEQIEYQVREVVQAVSQSWF